MRASMELAVLPIGAESLSDYVAACQRVLAEAGLEPRLHAFGTEVEGEWETLMTAVRRCHEAVHDMGAPRILTHVKLLTRSDGQADLSQPVASVRRKQGA